MCRPLTKGTCHVDSTHPPSGLRRCIGPGCRRGAWPGRVRTAGHLARPRRPGVRRARAADRVWVALSPWFITLQNTGTNATIVNLISGLAVAGVAAFTLASPRGFAGLQLGSALLGAWLIIAGPILSQKFSIADPMYWSNSLAGGLLIVLAAAGLAAVAMGRPARR